MRLTPHKLQCTYLRQRSSPDGNNERFVRDYAMVEKCFGRSPGKTSALTFKNGMTISKNQSKGLYLEPNDCLAEGHATSVGESGMA